VTGYWKFLRPGRLSPFARYPWPAPGQWVEVPDVVPCRQGVHACRRADLPYWLLDELWQVELDGTVVSTPTKVAAQRGRLVDRVDAWNPDTAREFGWACVARTAGHAVAELDAAGLAEPAADLGRAMAGPPQPRQVTEAATRAAQTAEAAGQDTASWLSAYLVEAVGVLATEPVAAVAYIAVRAARQRSVPADPDAERDWQADWLARRLNLPGD
jgi:hypothetical protein